jgi:IS5 family transposase
MFRTIGDQVSLWESLLPEEVLRLPEELARVDVLLDDPAFFALFAPHFDPLIGRPSTPMECYLRLMFLKFRYRLGYESLCQEVADSISWRRFCRIPLDGQVPHPTTLMKLTTRCGEAAVAGLNEALWAKAAEAKLLCTAGARRYHGDPGERGQPDGLGAAGQGGRQAGADGAPGAGRGRGARHGGRGPAAGGGGAGAPDRGQAAHSQQAGPGGKQLGDPPGNS